MPPAGCSIGRRAATAPISTAAPTSLHILRVGSFARLTKRAGGLPERRCSSHAHRASDFQPTPDQGTFGFLADQRDRHRRRRRKRLELFGEPRALLDGDPEIAAAVDTVRGPETLLAAGRRKAG